MSFPRYPEYKDSGVEWLGEVPVHWDINRLKSMISLKKDTVGVNSADYKLLSLTLRGVIPRDLENPQGKFPAEFDTYQKVEPDDLIFCLFDVEETPRAVGISSELGMVTGAYTVGKVREEHSPQYVHYYYLSRDQYKALKMYYTGLRNVIRKENFYSIPCPQPPLIEQRAIATFLDHETAKIDALVAEQEKLIALLQEKRQAVISHAVTKGLDPNVPMKDSGVEWLGEVPEHWEVLKGTLIGSLFGSEQVPEDLITDDGDLPFIKVGSMSSDSFEIESWNWFVDRSVDDHYRAKTGFIVFPKRGAAIFLNKVNIVDRPSLIDPNLMGWEIGKHRIREFFAYALKSRKLDEIADVSTVPQINNKHIGPERFPVPPVNEQRDIVIHLQAETGKIDSLIAETQSAIGLLQERRTALISAAVTGQIDVRGLASASNAPDSIAACAYPVSA